MHILTPKEERVAEKLYLLVDDKGDFVHSYNTLPDALKEMHIQTGKGQLVRVGKERRWKEKRDSLIKHPIVGRNNSKKQMEIIETRQSLNQELYTKGLEIIDFLFRCTLAKYYPERRDIYVVTDEQTDEHALKPNEFQKLFATLMDERKHLKLALESLTESELMQIMDNKYSELSHTRNKVETIINNIAINGDFKQYIAMMKKKEGE